MKGSQPSACCGHTQFPGWVRRESLVKSFWLSNVLSTSNEEFLDAPDGDGDERISDFSLI